MERKTGCYCFTERQGIDMLEIKIHYPSVDQAVEKVKSVFAQENPRVGDLFENCITDTIQKTVHILEDGSVFVITGDIPAMWLRDSACQLMPFVRFAKTDEDIRDLLTGLAATQVRQIIADPYANAFKAKEDPSTGWMVDKTDMKPILWERKYEIDSLCHPIDLHYRLWKETGSTAHFTPEWKEAAQAVIRVLHTEQNHESDSDYTFERADCPFTDTLSRNGKGALVKDGTGLVWSGFRPSDDACTYGYLIPSNMFASCVLGYISEIAREVYKDEEMAAQAAAFSAQIREAVEKYAVVPKTEKPFYAYEVDGFGQYLVMDDANLPSLLSMPYMGWCAKDDPMYLNTREVILSQHNPYYYEGKALRGIGSPHTPVNYVWDIALAMEGLTSDDRDEQLALIMMMEKNDAGTGQMHEGIDVNDPSHFTRPWFSWANSMFCELVMQYCGI